MFFVHSCPGFNNYVTNNFGNYDVSQSEWHTKDVTKAQKFYSQDVAHAFRRYAREELGFDYYVRSNVVSEP